MASRKNTPIGTAFRSTATCLALRRPLRKGDNIFVEGSIEQRQFTPKRDGVQRTVHEVVVRNCHVIAAPRGATAREAPSTTSEETAIPDLQKGAIDHDGWPVG